MLHNCWTCSSTTASVGPGTMCARWSPWVGFQVSHFLHHCVKRCSDDRNFLGREIIWFPPRRDKVQPNGTPCWGWPKFPILKTNVAFTHTLVFRVKSVHHWIRWCSQPRIIIHFLVDQKETLNELYSIMAVSLLSYPCLISTLYLTYSYFLRE